MKCTSDASEVNCSPRGRVASASATANEVTALCARASRKLCYRRNLSYEGQIPYGVSWPGFEREAPELDD